MHDDQEYLDQQVTARVNPPHDDSDIDDLLCFGGVRATAPDARRLIEIRRELADLDEHLNDLDL
ncbi:MAG: hypothetical protein ACPGU7_04215 [Gammaproteobacteria bacterium]